MCFPQKLGTSFAKWRFWFCFSHFLVRIWKDMTTVQIFIYIHTHARFSVYNLSKKMCDQSRKGGFSRWRFCVNVQASPSGGGPLLVGRIHISHSEHRLSTASLSNFKILKVWEKTYRPPKNKPTGKLSRVAGQWKCVEMWGFSVFSAVKISIPSWITFVSAYFWRVIFST